jgi:hypothetical protein
MAVAVALVSAVVALALRGYLQRRALIACIVDDGLEALSRSVLRYDAIAARHPSLVREETMVIGHAGGYRDAVLRAPATSPAFAAERARLAAARGHATVTEARQAVADALASVDATIARLEGIDATRSDTVRRMNALDATIASLRDEARTGEASLARIRQTWPSLALDEERVAYNAVVNEVDGLIARATAWSAGFDRNDLERIEARARELAPIEARVTKVLKGLRAPTERLAALERAPGAATGVRVVHAATEPHAQPSLAHAEVDPFVAVATVHMAMAAHNAAVHEVHRMEAESSSVVDNNSIFDFFGENGS